MRGTYAVATEALNERQAVRSEREANQPASSFPAPSSQASSSVASLASSSVVHAGIRDEQLGSALFIERPSRRRHNRYLPHMPAQKILMLPLFLESIRAYGDASKANLNVLFLSVDRMEAIIQQMQNLQLVKPLVKPVQLPRKSSSTRIHHHRKAPHGLSHKKQRLKQCKLSDSQQRSFGELLVRLRKAPEEQPVAAQAAVKEGLAPKK
jgi:hypothetical protein